jgi:uncharacterized protein YyaL (SSP411 family)
MERAHVERSVYVGLFAVLVPISALRSADPPPEARKAVPVMTESAATPRTNRLAKATSPYLLQHARNPVDWYEWGADAFEKARKDDRPVFLSIGYAACHWCHVMEHESFENEAVARVLNEKFVSIKVDREERPDIDEIYMAYTQARTGHGGWPMSVWLTPDGLPFFAGTYFPREQFVSVLQQIGEIWNSRREQILTGADGAADFFRQWSADPPKAEGVPDQRIIDDAAATLARVFDSTFGGIASGTNKFPPGMAMELMLRAFRRTGNARLLEAVETTLDHMARGGIYDHLGGGICRYSTDPEWLVPHFEKMLYDQALVSAIYLDAWQATKKPQYAAVAADIFDYVISDLQSPEGGFYSSRDADSDGLEGAFYVWTVDAVHDVLGPEEGKLACAYFDVTETGNWFERMGHAPPGPKNILRILKPPSAFAQLHKIALTDLEQRITNWKKQLRSARLRRTPPPLDDKILTAWNGLMIATLAKGSRILTNYHVFEQKTGPEPAENASKQPEKRDFDAFRYRKAAIQAAECVLNHLKKDGRLLRTYRKGEARFTAYLEDYAFLVEGLLNLYEATFDRRWLDEAAELTEISIRFYFDDAGGGFFFTASDGEKLVARSKNPHDSAIPAGNSVHAMNLLRLSILLDRKDYRTKAESIFRTFGNQAERNPYAFERHLAALDFYHARVKEIAIIGDPASPETAALLGEVYGRYVPNKVVVLAPDKVEDSHPIPLLRGKARMSGKPTASVCENYRCRLPVTSPAELAKQMEP